jgi:hypothetical protein
MDDAQKVIITFPLNKGPEARDIADRLQAQFGQHVYSHRAIQFWITEVRFGRQDLHDEISTGRSPLDDFNAKIRALSDRSLLESARSISEILRVVHSTILLHLHDSTDFRPFRLY